MTPLRSVRGTPWNGFIRSALGNWLGCPLMVDLVTGAVRPGKAGVLGSSLAFQAGLGRRGPVYLPMPSASGAQEEGGDAVVQCARKCAQVEVDVVLQIAVADLAEQAARITETWETMQGGRATLQLVLDPLSLMACSSVARFDSLWDILERQLPEGLSTVLLLPLVGGLATSEELEELIKGVRRDSLTAVVPVQVEAGPRELRALVDYAESYERAMDEDRLLRLFHQESPSRREASVLVARRGMEWWFEPSVDFGAGRLGRHAFIFSQLSLIAELGEWLQLGTGFVEGHLQAARRIEVFPHDLAALLREGNLELLDWLDQRVEQTLTEWAIASANLTDTPPRLTRLRGRFVADSQRGW